VFQHPEMSDPDYYLVDCIFVCYNPGCEVSDVLKITRSKQPRKVGPLAPGQTKAAWIDENEDIVTRVIYEGGIWNVKDWESALYISEIADYNLSIDTVISIKRIMSYVFP
jgi:hypothetical protein